jgi:peptidoglycan/xylan/chitin deacetylase (PgdA/CDA1 family)
MTPSERIKYAIKVVVSHALYGMGLLQLWQYFALKRRAVVLMYHRVLTLKEMQGSGSHPSIMIERETFAKQMGLVKRRFKVLSIEEFTRRMEHKIPFENSSCLITFDDGWKDNYTHALPILKANEIPAVVFLPVNYIGQRRHFWHEALVQFFVLAVKTARKEPARAARLREVVAQTGCREIFDVLDEDPRPHIIEVISKNRKGLLPSVIDAALSDLSRELGVDDGDLEGIDRFVDWEEVVKMSQAGIEFGGHGAEHRLLSHLSTDEAREDIQRSKDVLDRQVKVATPTFSYPRGYWTAQVVELVKASGFRLAFLAKGGSVSCQDDPYTLRRINIAQAGTESMPMFLARVVGLF